VFPKRYASVSILSECGVVIANIFLEHVEKKSVRSWSCLTYVVVLAAVVEEVVHRSSYVAVGALRNRISKARKPRASLQVYLKESSSPFIAWTACEVPELLNVLR
jgi:hypothetical protein